MPSQERPKVVVHCQMTITEKRVDATMKPRVRLLAALPGLWFASTLDACIFLIGDPYPGIDLQAYAPKQRKEDVARTIDEAIVAAGLKGAGDWQTVSLGGDAKANMTSYFMMPDKRTNVSATIEDRPRGARVCIRITGLMGHDEFEPDGKAAIARLRAALIDKIGEAT